MSENTVSEPVGDSGYVVEPDGLPAGGLPPRESTSGDDTFVERWRLRAERASVRYQAMAVEQPLFGLPLAFLARYTARQGMLLASATAFRLFLWLMPLALLSAALLAGFTNGDPSGLKMVSEANGITAATRQQMVVALQQGQRSWWLAALIGGAAFLWTTRTLMRSLRIVNAHVWSAPLPRARQKDLLLTTLMFAGSWIVIFSAVTAVAALGDYVPGGVLLVVPVQAILLGGAWLMLCTRLPDRRTGWTDLLPGAVIFGVSITILHVVSRVYLPTKFEHSSQLYGSLGIAATILAWLLLIGQVIVSAGLANAVWAEFRADRASAEGESADTA